MSCPRTQHGDPSGARTSGSGVRGFNHQATVPPSVSAYAKTKTQISFAVTAKLISAFVFALRIVQLLYYINPKFLASSHLLWLYSPVCVGPGRKPRRPVFSQRGSFVFEDRILVLLEPVPDHCVLLTLASSNRAR